MIKFFRNIRKRLVNESKFSKYLLYAIGEIILVVIGILIALQINNWNEIKKTKEKERQVLTEIISDLEYSLTDLNVVLTLRENNLKRTIHSLKTIIKILETNQSYYDSLGYNFRAANAYDAVDFKTSGYQSLISIGTDLIENQPLRSSIGKFYSSTKDNVNSAFEEVHQDFYSYMIDYYRKNFVTMLDQGQVEKMIPNDFEALKNDTEYVQSLRAFLSVNVYYFDVLNDARTEAIQLKQDIENYLND